jgi:hypothetical protein
MMQPEVVSQQICVKSSEQTFFGTVIHVPKTVCHIGELLKYGKR